MGNGSGGEQNEPKRVKMIRLGHMYAIKCTTTSSSLSVLVSTSDYINFMFLISIPLPMDRIPISIPMLKPIQIRTRGARVRVWTDTGTDDLKNTHGLPVSNTSTYKQSHNNEQTIPTSDSFGV